MTRAVSLNSLGIVRGRQPALLVAPMAGVLLYPR
jgi:hypothetical protein